MPSDGAMTSGAAASAAYPLVPYGWADFRAIRLEGRLYVDKTRFLRPLEDERFVFLIRPRRFGKSCWLSLLENYYDRKWASEFEQVFGGTDIGREPTRNRHSFVVLRFDFSEVRDAPETLEREFEYYCGMEIRRALERHPDLFSDASAQRISSAPSTQTKLAELFLYASTRDIRLFALIDEYDNFANTILAHHGADVYHELTHGSGFYRNFFAALKGGAGRSGGGLERLFVTGVSPITLDDVTSGFNIGKNISLLPEFNAALGFTEAEVRGLLQTYREAGALAFDEETALDVMREWYDGYRFAEDAKESVYNTDMVLYFLDAAMPNKPMPNKLVDVNVRIDYGKLRHLLTVSRGRAARAGQGGGVRPDGAGGSDESAGAGRQLNGNFDLLRQVVGEGQADAEIQASFPLERLDQRDNFLSLLHYFGLLSIREAVAGDVRLHIPNQTVRQLLYGHLRDAYDDVGVLSVDLVFFAGLLRRMAREGEWQPVFDFLRDAIAEQTSIRDYLDGEKIIQGFLAAYLGLSPHFLMRTEPELGKGFADISLEPLAAQHPELRHGFLIELKYLKRGEDASEAKVQAVFEDAHEQLRRYLADDRLARAYPSARFTGLAVVFHGWEMVRCQATVP